jgi:ribosomal protein S18 acetylase RimI-like enzyme
MVEENKSGTSIECHIAKAQTGDIENMLRLWRAIPGLGVGQGDEVESLKTFMNMNPSTCLVLKINDDLIGTVLGGFDGRRGYLYHLAVHPDHQGRGYGKKLLARVIQELKLLGAAKIHLFSFSDNPKAAQFYEKQGWERRQDIKVFSWNMGSIKDL